jgi:hypothetical protein
VILFAAEGKGGRTMKKNVGGIDSIIRTALGVVAVLVGFFVSMSMGLRIAAFLIAVILLFFHGDLWFLSDMEHARDQHVQREKNMTRTGCAHYCGPREPVVQGRVPVEGGTFPV